LPAEERSCPRGPPRGPGRECPCCNGGVFVGAEIPDARRGLCELDESILSGLRSRGHGSSGRFIKSANLFAEVAVDVSPDEVYERVVTLAQDFTTRYPLICGEGNFGSIDGDPRADAIYTECRLSAAGEAVVEDSRFPVLLVNGAVGSRTVVPPHNLDGIARAATELLDHPAVPVKRLVDLIGGPDFATGGVISDCDPLAQMYVSGRGRLVLDGRVHFEHRSRAELTGRELDHGSDDGAWSDNFGAWSDHRPRLVITELPYGVPKGGDDGVIKDIANAVVRRQLPEIIDLRDESDRRGMRITLTLSSEDSYDEVRQALLELTRLRTTISVHMVAAVDGAPRILGLRELITAHLDQRRSVLGDLPKDVVNT
jgi:DNA gyrase subunit A